MIIRPKKPPGLFEFGTTCGDCRHLSPEPEPPKCGNPESILHGHVCYPWMSGCAKYAPGLAAAVRIALAKPEEDEA